jgi:hypothetical protein
LTQAEALMIVGVATTVAVSEINAIGGEMVWSLDFKTVSGVFSLLTSLLPQAGRIEVPKSNKRKIKFLVMVFKDVLQKIYSLKSQLFYRTFIIS